MNMEGFVQKVLNAATAPNASLLQAAKAAHHIYIIRSMDDLYPAGFFPRGLYYEELDSIDFANDIDAILKSGTDLYTVDDIFLEDDVWSNSAQKVDDCSSLVPGDLVIEGFDDHKIYRAVPM